MTDLERIDKVGNEEEFAGVVAETGGVFHDLVRQLVHLLCREGDVFVQATPAKGTGRHNYFLRLPRYVVLHLDSRMFGEPHARIVS